ncbi:MAG: ABC transporter permease [Candidatus Promineifilaceae bacterium]
MSFRLLKRLLPLIPLIFFGIFYFYPLASILQLSFAPEGEWQLATVRKLVTDNYYARTLWFTLWQAVASTTLTLLLALPAAYVFATYTFAYKQTLRTISTLPFVLPTVVVANAFTALIGPNGIVNATLQQLFSLEAPPIDIDQTIWMILLAHVFYNYSVALRIVSAYWQRLNPELASAAATLGASPREIFRTITLPLLRPAITAAGALVFIFTFTSFGVVLLLGGPRFATLEVEIYRQAVNIFDLPVAAALSLFQIVFTFVLMALYTRTQSQIATQPTQAKAALKPVATRRDRLIVGGNLLVMFGLLASPLLALVLRSFAWGDASPFLYYTKLFENERGSVFYVPPIEAVSNSLTYALFAMLVALVIGLICAYLVADDNRWLDPLFMLPLATSAVTLGFGYIIALDEPPLNLRNSLALIPLAHALVAIPFVIRTVLPALRGIDPAVREAATTLGANPQQVWLTIDWPLLRRVLLVAAVFAFTISMGEFGATVFVARPDSPTMPTAIFRFLGRPGAVNFGQALAMSTLLMFVCTAGFILIERLRVGDHEGEF